MTRRSIIAGTGAALPARCVSNDELAAWKNIDTTDEWIVERTGIRTRYIADESETTGTLAAGAARKALDAGGRAPRPIGLFVVATATPDQP
jgi:3-oxoacyl-[acyl-carrier-protein] synthase-3